LADFINIRWSVWDASPTVRWLINGADIGVTLEKPPAGVCILPLRRQIVVITAPVEDGANELQFYSYEGIAEAVVSSSVTNLPRCQFAFAKELSTGEIEATVSYEGAPWGCDHSGILDLATGTISRLHPIR
jgi:hypothetical protein